MRHIELIGGGRMPVIGLGTWPLRGHSCIEAVRTALDLGYRHIDTAEMYQNESEVGEAVHSSQIDRDEIFITTKVWTNHLHKHDVLHVAESSLRNLKSDYIDLFLVHWPNESVPLFETLGAFKTLLSQGKVRAIGVSNFSIPLMRKALEECEAPIANNQVEFHARLGRASEVEWARRHGISVTAYSPLDKGSLAKNQVLARIGTEFGGKTASQVALRWLIEHEGVAAVPKASSERRMRENMEIFDFSLSEDQKKRIETLGRSG